MRFASGEVAEGQFRSAKPLGYAAQIHQKQDGISFRRFLEKVDIPINSGNRQKMEYAGAGLETYVSVHSKSECTARIMGQMMIFFEDRLSAAHVA